LTPPGACAISGSERLSSSHGRYHQGSPFVRHRHGLSRILGLVREQVFAFLFGVGVASDAFNAAFRIPNLLRDLFAENALSNAFVPVLTAARGAGKDEENRFASNILNTLLLTVGLITILGMMSRPPWPGSSESAFRKSPEKRP